jgi:hypothetical protein
VLVFDRTARSLVGRRALVGASLVVAVVVCALVGTFVAGQLGGSGHSSHDEGPVGGDYLDIAAAPMVPATPKPGPGASTGSFTENCGTDADGRHRNPDNVIAQPGQPGAAHHVHDYAGNLSTNAFSTDERLAAAATTCPDGDRSTYYWPVLRLLDQTGSDDNEIGGGADGNHGRIIAASSALIRFSGSPVTNVVPMPEFLRATVGDPKALTDGLASRADPNWTCTGYQNRATREYPLCPAGSDVVRIFTFPNCWNGTALDSATHTTQVVPAGPGGVCPHATFAVPQLTLTLTYRVPPGVMYAIDSFPEQSRSPLSDHADFIDVLTPDQQAKIVNCVNSDQRCQ